MEYETPLPETRAPSKRLSADLLGPLKDQFGKKRYILVMTDAFTKFVRLSIVSSKEPQEVAAAIVRDWCLVLGVPEQLQTDAGQEFCAAVAENMWKELQINHTKTTPYWPRANGGSEVVNKTIAHFLRAMIEDAKENSLQWEQYIPSLAFT